MAVSKLNIAIYIAISRSFILLAFKRPGVLLLSIEQVIIIVDEWWFEWEIGSIFHIFISKRAKDEAMNNNSTV